VRDEVDTVEFEVVVVVIDTVTVGSGSFFGGLFCAYP
jgi:hypothetical protein